MLLYRHASLPPLHHLDRVALHIVQRDHNREAGFFCDDDYRSCLLLITPEHAGAVPEPLISLDRRYVQYINSSYGRLHC